MRIYLSALYHKIFYSEDLKGIALIIMSCLWLAVMAILIRYLSTDFSAFQLVFLRNLFSVFLLLPWAYKYIKKTGIKLERLDLLIGRAFSGLAGMVLLFLALYKLPTAQVTALSFTAPLITTLRAAIILKEKVSHHFWLSLVVGFIGVLIILRPGTDMFQVTGLLVLSATFFWSISNIYVKKLSVIYNPNVLVLIIMSMLSVISIPAAIWQWQPINYEKIAWVFLLAWVTTQAQVCISKAYKHADIKTLMPFDFMRLIFVSIFAYIIFGEVLDLHTLAGAVIITVSGIYVVFKVTKKGSVLEKSRGKLVSRL